MSVRTANLIASILVTAFGVFFAVNSLGLFTRGSRGDPGPGAFPLVTALLIAIGGVVYIVTTLRSTEHESFFTRDPVQGRQVLYMVLSVAGYVLLMQYGGFTLSTFIFTLFQLWLIGRYNVILSLALSAVLAFSCLYIFQSLLFVPLPEGSLWH